MGKWAVFEKQLKIQKLEIWINVFYKEQQNKFY